MEIFMWMPITTLFIIATTGRQPRCFSVDECLILLNNELLLCAKKKSAFKPWENMPITSERRQS
jgi:hypothetical protein